MGSKKTVTTGYWYGMGLHMVTNQGAVNSVKEIRIGDRVAWTGDVSTSSRITINKPSLFGGESREGGVQGELDIAMGLSDQTPNDYLTSKQGVDQPAYKGVLSFIWRGGWLSALNPYIKPWSFKVMRTTAGWSSTNFDAATTSVDLGNGLIGMNPAHIIYECLTNTRWGLGYSASAIDTANFQAAATALRDEGFGLCLTFTRSDSIENFIQIIVDHIGAVLNVNQKTGLYELALIRGDYVVADLPLFDESNILELREFERAGQGETVNSITVNYIDQTNGESATVSVQDLAGVQSQGGVIHRGVNYPGLATHSLAARVAARDLQILSAPLAKIRITTNRDGFGLIPGAVIRFSWDSLGIVDLPCRVIRVDYGNLTDGKISVDMTQDVFSLPSTAYIDDQISLNTPTDTSPAAPTEFEIIESNYRDIVGVLGVEQTALLPTTTGYPRAIVKKPNQTQYGVIMGHRVGAAEWNVEPISAFNETGILNAPVDLIGTTISIAGLAEGTDYGDSILISDELMAISSIDFATGNVVVKRACNETNPQTHSAGTTVYFPDTGGGYSSVDYAVGETVANRLQTFAIGGVLDELLAPVVNLQITARAFMPYPPKNLYFFSPNLSRFPSEIGEIKFSAHHIDRVILADKLTGFAESGSTDWTGNRALRLRVYDDTNTLRDTVTYNVAMGANFAYSFATEKAAGGFFDPVTVGLSVVELDSGDESPELRHTMTRKDLPPPAAGTISTAAFSPWFEVASDVTLGVTIPAGVQAGDAIVIAAMYRTLPFTPPPGFTLYSQSYNAYGSTGQYSACLLKIADGTEGGTVVTLTQGGANRIQGIVGVYRSSTGALFLQGEANGTDITGAEQSLPSYTPTASDEFGVFALSSIYRNTSAVEAMALTNVGSSALAFDATLPFPDDQRLVLASGALTIGESTGSYICFWDYDGSFDRYTGSMISLRPL